MSDINLLNDEAMLKKRDIAKKIINILSDANITYGEWKDVYSFVSMYVCMYVCMYVAEQRDKNIFKSEL